MQCCTSKNKNKIVKFLFLIFLSVESTKFMNKGGQGLWFLAFHLLLIKVPVNTEEFAEERNLYIIFFNGTIFEA